MMPKLPEGKSYGYIFNIASGSTLDVYGEAEGVPRKRWLFISEPDFLYKPRIVKAAIAKEEGNVDTYYYLFGFINIGKSVGYWDGSNLRSWAKPFVRVVHK